MPAFLLIILVFSWVFYREFKGPEKSKEKERYIIKLDMSEEKIIDDLKEKGFLKNKTIFNLVLNIKGWRGKVAPGAYMLSKSMDTYKLAGTLIYGPFQKWVVIPPGKRKEQTALILQKVLGWSEGLVLTFVNAAEEGYLFPDTYLIETDADPQQIINKLKNNFNEKFSAQLQKDLLAQNIRNDTAIKIASLIERESGGSEDKALISGIIWNRLNKGMKLEIDATVQYAITSYRCNPSLPKAESCLLNAEFNFWPILGSGMVRTVDSLYNTYQVKALPSGPICSPGLDSIKAVIYPAETEALFYLHSSDKQIHTAKTYKEHLENIEKYL